MALSDCQKCWNTPCECGYDYLKWDAERITALVYVLGKVMAIKQAYPESAQDEQFEILTRK